MTLIATPPAPESGEYSTIDAGRIRVGATLFAPVYDVRNVLLLAEGQTVTEAFLERLRDHRIQTVRVHDRDIDRFILPSPVPLIEPAGTAKDVPPDRPGSVAAYRNEASDRLDAEICLDRLQMPRQGEPFLTGVRHRGKNPYEADVRARIVASYNRSMSRLSRVYDRLAAGDGLDRAALDELADRALSDLGEDGDLFACLGGNPAAGGYPVRHSLNTAMLAMAVGVRLGLDTPTLRELVIGCLVHDAGMLLLDRNVYDHASGIDVARFLEITKHPILVFDVLKDTGAIPKRSAFIAYQMHERCDGSGYPRRRAGSQIHFLSKVAGLADAYVALVSPRSHRPAMMPYHAMEKILRDANRGLFDCGVVRALLRTLSLFPLGSYVELSDGRRARVLRAGEEYHRPVVEICGGPPERPETIDLAEERTISVVRALPATAVAAAG
ncbi:MAG TPA: HD domain-containing phosphohydrolase [Planctomycetaceae bacterium]